MFKRSVYDIATGFELVYLRETDPYAGPWERCKESGDQAQAQANVNSFNQTLLDTFKANISGQEAILSVLVPQLEGMAAKPQGFGATEYAALQAKIVNDTGAQYSQVAKAAATEFATSNEAGLPSGVEEQVQAGISSAAAGQVAGESTNLAVANEQLKQQQQQFAIGSLAQIQGGLGSEAGGFAGQTGAGFQNAFNNATTIYNQGSMWKNILGGVVGAGLNFATGGLSGLAQGGSFLAGGGQALGGSAVTG